MSSIVTRYQQALTDQELQPDPYQAHAIATLQQCLKQHSQPKRHWSRLLPFGQHRSGVYLWGNVGRGKTLLMNLFYASLPTPKKQRWHFQEFMHFVHQQLQQLQGQTDPLASMVATLAEEIDVLCLDELLVEDVTDAMLLANLLPALLAHNILFVTTANLAPADLYPNGWQRERFLPTIRYLQKHLHIVHLNHPQDYRRSVASLLQNQPAAYVHPDDPNAEAFLQKNFQHLSTKPTTTQTQLQINDRWLTVRKLSKDVLWCDFADLCLMPRNSHDYLVLCARFHTIIVSHVPVLDENLENAARRFMSLVDICYDRRIRLFISARVAINALYCGKLLQEAFSRTISRLWEMQTARYNFDRCI